MTYLWSTIVCTKKENLWIFDEEFRDGTSVVDEPLMHEATALIDKVIANKYDYIPDKIVITYSEDSYLEETAEVILDWESDCGEASYYRDRVSNDRVWLCPVLQRMDCFDGKKPKTFYVYIDDYSMFYN